MDALGRPILAGDRVAYIARFGTQVRVTERVVAGTKKAKGDHPPMVKFIDGIQFNVCAHNCVNLTHEERKQR